MHMHIRRSLACAVGLLLAAGSLIAQQKPGLMLADARKALAAAHAAAAKMPVALTCTIVDARGDVVAMERMDGARFFTMTISHGKARASAAFGAPSGGLAQVGSLGLGSAVGDPVYFVQGAVPLMRANQLIGALGCSGGSGQQDEDAAKVGAAAF